MMSEIRDSDPNNQTELLYTVTTTPAPLIAGTSGVQITITAANPNPTPDTEPVYLNQVMIQFPIGNDDNQLSPTASMKATTPTGWTQPNPNTWTGFVQFIFQAENPDEPVQVGDTPVQFVFTGVDVNAQSGTVEIDVTECNTDCSTGPGPACTDSDCPVQPIYVTKFPNAWDGISFWVDPSDINFGDSTTLNWNGPAEADYRIHYFVDNKIQYHPPLSEPPYVGPGTYPPLGQSLTPAVTTKFTLDVQQTINGQNYEWQFQQWVTVGTPQPQITSFSGSVDKTTSPWQLLFSWTTEYVGTDGYGGQCFLSNNTGAPLNPAGTDYPVAISPPQSVYALNAVNDAGQVASSLDLTWARAGSWQGSATNPIDLAFAPDGSRLYVANNLQVAVFTPSSNVNTPLNTTKLAITGDGGTIYTAVAVSADGSTVYVAANDYSNGETPTIQIQTFSASNLTQTGSGASISDTTATITNMAVWTGSGASYLFAADTYNSKMLVFTITGNSSNPLQAFGSPVEITGLGAVRTSPDGTQIYLTTGFTVDVYTPTGNADNPLSYVDSYAVGGNTMQGFGVAAGLGYPVAVYDNMGQVTMLDTVARTVSPSPATISGQIGSVAVSPDGTRVYAGMFDSGSIWAIVPSGLVAGQA
jgi:DNA-binding beta-propeller fold protein YncE